MNATKQITPAGPYPADLFDDARDALFLFGAGFLGANDAVYALRAGVAGTVVDTDQGKLDEMRPLYPDDWKFVCWDAFACIASLPRRFDVVSADPFTGVAAARCLALLPELAGLASRALTLTIPSCTPAQTLDGWDATTMGRTRLAGWLVLTR